jgi:hypothetical protein
MKIKALTLLILIALSAFTIEAVAQVNNVRVPLNSSFKQTLPDEQPMYYLELTPLSENKFEGTIFTKEKVRTVAKGLYTKFGDKYLEDGSFTFYYKMGNKECEGDYEKGARVGHWKRYNPDGSEKPTRYYNPEGAAMLRKALGYDKL